MDPSIEKKCFLKNKYPVKLNQPGVRHSNDLFIPEKEAAMFRRQEQRRFLCSVTQVQGSSPRERTGCGMRMLFCQRGDTLGHLREETWTAWNHIWRIEHLALDSFWIALLCKQNPMRIRIKMYFTPIFLIKTEKWNGRQSKPSDPLSTQQKSFRSGGEIGWQRTSGRPPMCMNTGKTFRKNEEERNLDLFSHKDRRDGLV